jgi:hypothetical protein
LRSVGELTKQEEEGEGEGEGKGEGGGEGEEGEEEEEKEAASVKPIATKFGTSLRLTDGIIRSKFEID